MAPKRPLPAEDPPPASSDDDESAGSSGDEEPEEEEEEEEEGGESGESEGDAESDDEDNKKEQKKPPQPKSAPPPPAPLQPQLQHQQQKSPGASSAAGSESESESGSESGSGSESESRRYTVKPIASKPMEKTETPPPAKKQRAEPSSSSKQPSAKRKAEVEDSKAKRKVEVEDSKEAKKGRKKDVAENGSLQKSGEESKKLFQRIWGDNDEIALLQGMIDFRENKGMDPSANTNAFHHYVKKSLGQEFSDSQLANKIRVLKKKYNNNEGKGKDGEDRAFSKPHEQKVFELSKKIWGANKSSDVGGSGEQTPMPKANGTAKKSKTATTGKVVPARKLKMETSLEGPKEHGELIPSEHSDTGSMLSFDKMLQISGIGLDQDFLKKGWEMVDELRKEELKERWRKVQLAEMRLMAERATLVRDQTNIVLEAYERGIGK